jgi:hypothetical protein
MRASCHEGLPRPTSYRRPERPKLFDLNIRRPDTLFDDVLEIDERARFMIPLRISRLSEIRSAAPISWRRVLVEKPYACCKRSLSR